MPPKQPMFAGGSFLPQGRFVRQLRLSDVALPRVTTVPQGRLTVGEVVHKLLEEGLDVSGLLCAAGDSVPKAAN